MNKDSKKLIGIIAVVVVVVVLLVIAVTLLHFDVIKFLKEPMTILMLFILVIVALIGLCLKFGKSR